MESHVTRHGRIVSDAAPARYLTPPHPIIRFAFRPCSLFRHYVGARSSARASRRNRDCRSDPARRPCRGGRRRDKTRSHGTVRRAGDAPVRDIEPGKPRREVPRDQGPVPCRRELPARFPEWKERIGEVVARASRDFEAVFAMRFAVVRCRAWDYVARNVGDPQEQMTRLAAVDPAPAGRGDRLHRRRPDDRGRPLQASPLRGRLGVPLGRHVAVADIRREQKNRSGATAGAGTVRGLRGVLMWRTGVR